ncbi:MoaD/ThiS family protein [Herbidospora sp. NBRC 101105]|uniref:MoaD/ThiS family protein n=1 Tax=Herbidospora sp. NBRC 101105 TaxID=3032195 RepID=UPI0024A23792|nr:MoaD/ThiS family protein [Herbidospora sp. NBRC 101105]GLX95524.1 molybdopterin synthase sulfur carrier subunit [Herbidospora sp. NBRC 101105]
MTVIVIPSAWRTAAGIGDLTLTCAAETVGQAVEWLAETYPPLRQRVLAEPDRLANWVNVFVDGEDIRELDGLDTLLPSDNQIIVLPALAGG